MTMVRLVYFSRATRPISMLDIHNILEVARTHNEQLGVCGMLGYERDCFLQVLEGERSCVNELYLLIADDPRHSEVEIISYDYIDEPLFGNWQMGFVAVSDDFYKLLEDIGASRFDPSLFTPSQALQFLHGLSLLSQPD